MILIERKANDLEVQLEWEGLDGLDHIIIHVSDRYGSWQLFPSSRREAVEMYWHPYIYSRDWLDQRAILQPQEVTA